MIADYETKQIPKNVLANKLYQLAEQLSTKENEYCTKTIATILPNQWKLGTGLRQPATQ